MNTKNLLWNSSVRVFKYISFVFKCNQKPLWKYRYSWRKQMHVIHRVKIIKNSVSSWSFSLLHNKSPVSARNTKYTQIPLSTMTTPQFYAPNMLMDTIGFTASMEGQTQLILDQDISGILSKKSLLIAPILFIPILLINLSNSALAEWYRSSGISKVKA